MTKLYIVCLLYLTNSVNSLDSHPKNNRVIVAGASGYIGRNVVRELVSRGIDTGAIIRPGTVLPEKTMSYLNGARLIYCDVLNFEETSDEFEKFNPTSTICCLASRSGVSKDAWAIDYLASLNTLKALVGNAKDEVDKKFVLLSAYCCGKPLLQFQHAKLKLEEEIRSSPITHSIVRPTAFFKSLDGQVESARSGNPILLFGDGSCSANPICEKDLAKFLVDCALRPQEINMMNTTRAIGGPDVPPLTKRQQADLIFDTLGIKNEKRKIIYLPLGIFSFFINLFSTLSKLLSSLNSFPLLKEKFDDATELARIVRYYAVEPMIAIESNEVQGKTSLHDHFRSIAARGGYLDEIDPMTTTTGVLNVFVSNSTYFK